MPSKTHWDTVYATKSETDVSWFQPHAEQSLQFIEQTLLPPEARLIDVGGGASTLVDDLLDRGHRHVTVLDLSDAALVTSRVRLGPRANGVEWISGDITQLTMPANTYDLWHDRAVFHFLTSREQREAYVRAVWRAVKPGGHVIVASFAEDGPDMCSGLPVQRYSADGLHAEFGEGFALLQQACEAHQTPAGVVQKFVYCLFRKAPH